MCAFFTYALLRPALSSPLPGKELFILLCARVVLQLFYFMFLYFPLGVVCVIWNLFESAPNHSSFALLYLQGLILLLQLRYQLIGNSLVALKPLVTVD